MRDVNLSELLPIDHEQATLVGRVFRPEMDGPSIVAITNTRVIDITDKHAPTLRDVCEQVDPVTYVQSAMDSGTVIGDIDAIAENP